MSKVLYHQTVRDWLAAVFKHNKVGSSSSAQRLWMCANVLAPVHCVLKESHPHSLHVCCYWPRTTNLMHKRFAQRQNNKNTERAEGHRWYRQSHALPLAHKWLFGRLFLYVSIYTTLYLYCNTIQGEILQFFLFDSFSYLVLSCFVDLN